MLAKCKSPKYPYISGLKEDSVRCQSDRNWKNHAILFTRLRHFRCTFLVLVQFSMALISSRRGSSKASSVVLFSQNLVQRFQMNAFNSR